MQELYDKLHCLFSDYWVGNAEGAMHIGGEHSHSVLSLMDEGVHMHTTMLCQCQQMH